MVYLRKAMKMMDKFDVTADNERFILKMIKNDNIIRYFDHFDLKISNSDYSCVITEFCEV